MATKHQGPNQIELLNDKNKPATAANQEHLTKLKEGPRAWNIWRMENPAVQPYLVGADLSQTDLSGAYLRGADLHNASFKDANLFHADLREADLRGTDLSAAKDGLLFNQLAGADLTAAKLPGTIERLYQKLASVSEISDSAKKLFLVLLGACLYCWLTIATTTDLGLITNGASSPLPIIQTAIPIVGFYVVAPLIILCIYFYFHFYLQKLWEELASLPAIFPDGRPLYTRAAPWLFNDLVRAHLPKLKEGRPFLSYFQEKISLFVAWWILPITLGWFWVRFLTRQDLTWTIFHAFILTLSIVSAIQLYRLAGETLRGYERTEFTWKKALRRGRAYTDVLRTMILFASVILLSIGVVFGDPEYGSFDYRSPSAWIPGIMEEIGYFPFANLTDTDLSVKPSDWTGKKDGELERVNGANLGSKNLRYVQGPNAFLAKADLRKAKLHGAVLVKADLRQANLAGAELTNANLSEAHLNGTDFGLASLASAQLVGADLSGAKLANADLRMANLYGAKLIGANLRNADLTGAHLCTGINAYGVPGSSGPTIYEITQHTQIKYAYLPDVRGLITDDVKKCEDWQMAYFDQYMLKQLELPLNHNETVYKQRKAEEEQQGRKATENSAK